MEERVKSGYLYDFYGELLNSHQKEIYEAYVLEDMTLQEIADEKGVSRQSVSDLLKRCKKQLSGYEDRLGLLARFMKLKENAVEIASICEDQERYSSEASRERIKKLSNEILDEL